MCSSLTFGHDKRRLPRKQRRKPSTDRASNLLETTIPTIYLLESCLPSPVAAQVPSFWLCGLHFGPSFWLSGPSILAFWVFTLGFWAFHSQGSTALPGSSLVLLASLRLALRYYAPPPQRGKHHGWEKLRVFLASRPASPQYHRIFTPFLLSALGPCREPDLLSVSGSTKSEISRSENYRMDQTITTNKTGKTRLTWNALTPSTDVAFTVTTPRTLEVPLNTSVCMKIIP